MRDLANRFLEETIEPGSEYPGDQTQKFAYAPDGLNSAQNAAVGMVKELVANWFNKPDVLKSIPALQSAISSNEPPLTIAEAIEIHHQLYGFYCGYFGCQETRLFDLLQAVEDLFPAVDFAHNRGGDHGDSS